MASLGKTRKFLGVRNLAITAANSIRKKKWEAVPVLGAMGAISFSVGLGLVIASRELIYGPDVFVSKKKRQEIPEIEEPDYVLEKSDKFVKKSLFRKLGHKSSLYHQIREAIASSSSSPTTAQQ